MRVALPLALFTAAAFSAHSLPVRAFPGASVNLVRIDGDGVKPLPDVTLLLSEVQNQMQAQQQAQAQAPAASPAPGSGAATEAAEPLPTNLTWLLTPSDELEISFSKPLPANSRGVLLLRVQPAPGSEATSGPGAGREVERISFPSPQVFLSDEGTFMAIQPETPLKPGEITTVEFQLGAGVVPDPETPPRFALALPAVARERKVAPCPYVPLPGTQAAAQAATQAASQAAAAGATGAAAAGTAGWVLPVVLGVAAIAAGAAIVSASGNGNSKKNGGRNVVSQ